MAIFVKSEAQTLPMSVLKNELIRHSLYKVLKIPVRASQLTGSFIFNLNSNAELSFSYFGWPFINSILQLLLCVIAFTIFLLHKSEYLFVFGNWNTTDLISNSLLIMLPFSIDIFTSIITYKGRNSFISFHNQQFVPSIAGILADYSSSADLMTRLKTVTSKQMWLSYKVYVLVVFSLLGYLAGLGTSLMAAKSLLKTTPNSYWVSVFIPFILIFMIARTTMCKAQFLVVSGNLSYIWVGLAALKDHLNRLIDEGTLEDEGRVIKCLNNLKRINDLIKEFNTLMQWILINGILTLSIAVLCYLFQFCSWYVEFGAVVIGGLAPGLISCLVTLHCLCEAASEIEIEVHKQKIT